MPATETENIGLPWWIGPTPPRAPPHGPPRWSRGYCRQRLRIGRSANGGTRINRFRRRKGRRDRIGKNRSSIVHSHRRLSRSSPTSRHRPGTWARRGLRKVGFNRPANFARSCNPLRRISVPNSVSGKVVAGRQLGPTRPFSVSVPAATKSHRPPGKRPSQPGMRTWQGMTPGVAASVRVEFSQTCGRRNEWPDGGQGVADTRVARDVRCRVKGCHRPRWCGRWG